MMAYGVFADYYDALTKNVNYAKKADYICALFERFGHKPEYALDLACGTGSLTIELKKRGIDIFGIDSSTDMLTQAMMKSDEAELDIMFIRQKMQSLELWGEIDTCVCTLDSLSHLNGRKELEKAFERVSYYMETGGLFVFDINTPYKHREILGNNTFVYDTDDVFLVWQNTYRDEDCSVKIDLDFFAPEPEGEGARYIRSSETFREYAYPTDTVRGLLENAGFEVLGVFDDFTFEPAREDSQRLTIAARKI